MAEKYLHLIQTDAEFQEEYSGQDYQEPWVSYTEETQEVNYNKEENGD